MIQAKFGNYRIIPYHIYKKLKIRSAVHDIYAPHPITRNTIRCLRLNKTSKDLLFFSAEEDLYTFKKLHAIEKLYPTLSIFNGEI